MRNAILAVPRFGLRWLQFVAGWAVFLFHRFVRPSGRRVRLVSGHLLPWCLALAAGGWLAYAIISFGADQPVKMVSAALGLLAAVLFVLRPEYSVIVILLLDATVVSPGVIPKPFTVGGQGFGVVELLIVLMLPVLFIRAYSDHQHELPRSPMIWPMVLLFVSVVLSVLVAYDRYIITPSGPFPFAKVYNGIRPMFHYLFFFIALYALDTREKVRMVLRIAMWAACIVAVMIVVQYFLGTQRWIFIGTPDSGLVTHEDFANQDIARPMPPGLGLILVMFVTAAGSFAYRRGRSALLALSVAIILGISLVFTYTRGIWVTSFMSCVIIWFAVNRRAKWRLATAMAVSIAGIVVLSTVVGGMAPGSAGQKFASNMRDRFLSIFEKETMQSKSIQNRIEENRYAIQQIRKNPLFGIGAGSAVGIMYWADPFGNPHIDTKDAIHNGYLELYMVYGLLGVISMVWLAIAFMVRGMYIYRRLKDPSIRILVLSFVAAYVGYLMRCSYSMALLHEIFNITTITLVMGLTEAIWRVYQEDPQTNAQTVALGRADYRRSLRPCQRVGS